MLIHIDIRVSLEIEVMFCALRLSTHTSRLLHVENNTDSYVLKLA